MKDDSDVRRFIECVLKRQESKKRGKASLDRNREYYLSLIPRRVWASERRITCEYPYKRLAIYTATEHGGGYQREEIGEWVRSLADVLRRGGGTEPIKAVRRTWQKDDLLWIVDGQQRYWAHWDAEKPIPVLVYDVASPEEEQLFFEISNDRRRVGSNLMLHNHVGPSTDMLRHANDTLGHPLYERIYFRSGGCGGRISAASLISAMSRFCGCTHGALLTQLSGIDRVIVAGGPKSRAAAEDFLRVVGIVFASPMRPTVEMLYALGRGLHGNENVPLPTTIVKRLLRVRLDRVKASTSRERMLLMSRRLERAITGKVAVED